MVTILIVVVIVLMILRRRLFVSSDSSYSSDDNYSVMIRGDLAAAALAGNRVELVQHDHVQLVHLLQRRGVQRTGSTESGALPVTPPPKLSRFHAFALSRLHARTERITGKQRATRPSNAFQSHSP